MRVAKILPFLLLAGCGDDGSGGAGGAVGTTTSAATSASPASGTGSSKASTGTQTTGATTGGSSGAGMGSPGCGAPDEAGEREETITVDGQSRRYTIHVPDAVDGMTPVPLIFGFHGFGGMGAQAAQYFGLTGDEAAIYVYPQAEPLPDQEGGIGWNMEEDGVDVKLVDALITALEADHCIDTTRVFAAGHSHGASFSNHLGCYRPTVFRAIAPVAGGGPWAGPCADGGVSAMLIHGSADDQVPIENGEGSRDHWLEESGCAGASSDPSDPAPCATYQGCTHTITWCQHDGGHEWPDFAGDGIRAFFLSF